MGGFDLRRTFLRLMIGSLVVAALLGAGVLLVVGSFKPLAGRTLATALTIALFSIISLGCVWSWEHGRRRGAAVAGLILSGVTFVVYMVLFWGDRYMPWELEELFGRIMAIGTAWAVLMAVFCVLGSARLRRGWSWVNIATQIAAGALAVLLSLAIIIEPRDDIYFRLLAALGILTGCGAICVPILHRLSAMPITEQVVTTKLILALTCPRCEAKQELPAGHSKCTKCGLRIHIEIEEEHCSNCGYVLYKLTSDRCPECGTPIASQPAASR